VGLGLALAAATTLQAGFFANAAAAEEVEIRIGWQKGSTLAVVKARGILEEQLEKQGTSVTWTEFPAGPQMLEALNVGSLDLGAVGETPPVFAQAARADLLYAGHEPPAPRAEVILVPKDSPIQSVADLKGKRVALNKGSNVHYLLVRALESAGLSYGDIEPAFLPPADARAAFEQGAVDAWAIWDPFAAAAEAQSSARRLVDGTGLVDNHIFYIAARTFAENHPDVLARVLEGIGDNGAWITRNAAEAAAIVGPQIGLDPAIAETSVRRYVYGVRLLDDDVVARQQLIADAFHDLGLIPTKLDIASVTWRRDAQR
jgi:sulfonate transport system substrate-binding protein